MSETSEKSCCKINTFKCRFARVSLLTTKNKFGLEEIKFFSSFPNKPQFSVTFHKRWTVRKWTHISEFTGVHLMKTEQNFLKLKFFFLRTNTTVKISSNQSLALRTCCRASPFQYIQEITLSLKIKKPTIYDINAAGMRLGGWIFPAERHFHINYESICIKYRLLINVKVRDDGCEVSSHYIFMTFQSLPPLDGAAEKSRSRWADGREAAHVSPFALLFTAVTASNNGEENDDNQASSKSTNKRPNTHLVQEVPPFPFKIKFPQQLIWPRVDPPSTAHWSKQTNKQTNNLLHVLTAFTSVNKKLKILKINP